MTIYIWEITFSPLNLHTQTDWCLLTGFLLVSVAASIQLYRHKLSVQSLVYQVTQLLTDGVYCRESAGRGAVKVVPVTDAALL